jgi:hypothetical protein
MIINEMFGSEKKPGYQTEKDDNSVPTIKDLRKTKLTLAQINRLRIMNDVRKLEIENKVETVQSQYGASADSQNQNSMF